MTNGALLDTIRRNCNMQPASETVYLINEVNAAMRKLCQRISFSGVQSLSRTIAATGAAQTSFPLPSDVHYLDLANVTFVNAATPTDNWKLVQGRAPIGWTGVPTYVTQSGRNLVINANTILVGDYLQFDCQVYPILGVMTAEFPHIDIEEFIINEVSAVVWAPIKTDMAEAFMALAKNNWTGILALYTQDQ